MIARHDLAIRSLRGAVAGLAATGPMSVYMLIGHRLLSWRSREALPPEIITREALRAADWHDNLSRSQEAGLIAINHFAYGTAMGAFYAQLVQRQSPGSAVVTGAAYGLAVWTGSYCGWLPAVGLYRPPTQDTAERTALMIGAHLIWGGTTGLLVHWLSRWDQRAGDGGGVRLTPGQHPANPIKERVHEGERAARIHRMCGMESARSGEESFSAGRKSS